MINILFYAEAHPFRESLTQHASLAKSYVRLAKHIRDLGHRAFVLANNETADRLVKEDPQAAYQVLRLARKDEAAVREDFAHWSESAIAEWVTLATRTGERCEKYEGILRRAYKRFPFDLVVMWGDNAAVNSFARSVGADVLHLELGPTRPPFPETFYFDPVGTNSLASFRQAIAGERGACPPREFWTALWAGLDNSEKTPGSYDFPFMLAGIHQQLGISSEAEICYIPLQLADDLNTQVGSRFASPLEFLQAVLPRVVADGYTAVVKPHPFSHTRSFNLLAERDAIRYAKSFADGVIVLGSDGHPQLGHWLLRNSAVVLTINSSVGFEAALFGTPVVLAGEAAYDGLGFAVLDERPLSVVLREIDTARVESVVARMLGHVLYPSRLFGSRKFARALIDSQRARGGDIARRVRSLLGSPLDYSLNWEAGSDDLGFAVPPGKAAGLVNRRVVQHRERLFIGDLALARDPHAFDTGIEKIESTESGYLISGWSYETGACVPPMIVLLSDGERILAAELASEPREHLLRKNKGTAMAGFSIVTHAALSESLSLILVSTDLRYQSVPIKVGRYR